MVGVTIDDEFGIFGANHMNTFVLMQFLWGCSKSCERALLALSRSVEGFYQEKVDVAYKGLLLSLSEPVYSKI